MAHRGTGEIEEAVVETHAKENPFALLKDLLPPARALGEDLASLDAAAAMARVDELLEGYVLPFAEVRTKVIDALGMAEGAELLVAMAYGERMLNRVWSAASDDCLFESQAVYPEALGAFEEAQRIADRHHKPSGGPVSGTTSAAVPG